MKFENQTIDNEWIYFEYSASKTIYLIADQDETKIVPIGEISIWRILEFSKYQLSMPSKMLSLYASFYNIKITGYIYFDSMESGQKLVDTFLNKYQALKLFT